MSWSFTIDEPTPSLNVLRRQYASARHYATLRNRFEQYVMVARMNEKIPKATAKRRVRIVRFATQEKYRLDHDNFIGGLKPLLDALVRQGLIVDDDAAHLEGDYVQLIAESTSKSRTVIKIQEMGM